MLILGLNKTTLLDYPEHVAATIFTGGCNLRCPFCHNRDLVFARESIDAGIITPYSEDEILSFLKKRRGILTGVCITGGEPTLHQDLPLFLSRIKELGMLVKLDTNGFRPDVLHHLLDEKLIDYCAIDIKNSPAYYADTVGLSSIDLGPLQESIDCLLSLSGSFPYEFRTTIVKELHSEEDMYAIREWIAGADQYFLQSYTDSDQVISSGYHAHDTDTLQHFASICRQTIPNVQLRGIDL